MTPATLIAWAQGGSALCWTIEALVLAAVSLFARDRALGALAAMLSIVGWTQVGFTIRWFVWHGAVQGMSAPELSWWLALYVTSSIEALFLAAAAAAYRWRR